MATRRDKGKPQLTERDRYCLNWIGQQYVVRMDTLQKLLGRMAGDAYNKPKVPGLIALRNVYRAIYRWENAGHVEYQKFWNDTPGWVWLTNAGLRSQQLSFAPWSPRQGSQFEHMHLVNELRVKLEDRYGHQLPWDSERILRKQFAESKEKRHVPDAIVTIDQKKLALEVEITMKIAKRTEWIIKNMLDHYDGIWYFVNDTTEPQIRRMSRHFDKLKVYRIKELFPDER